MPCLTIVFLLSLMTYPDAAIPADVSGTWDLSVTTSQGTFTPVITLRQDGENLSGTYRGRMGDTALKGTLKGSEIQFSVTLKFKDQDFVVTYSGTVEGNSMRGKVQFVEGSPGTWSGRRTGN